MNEGTGKTRSSGQWIIDSPQGPVGPYSTDQLRALLREGKVSGKTKVSLQNSGQPPVAIETLFAEQKKSTSSYESYSDDDPVTDLFNTLQVAREKSTKTAFRPIAPPPPRTAYLRWKWFSFVLLGSITIVAAVHWFLKNPNKPKPEDGLNGPNRVASTAAPTPHTSTAANKEIHNKPQSHVLPAVAGRQSTPGPRNLPPANAGGAIVRPIDPPPSEHADDQRNAEEGINPMVQQPEIQEEVTEHKEGQGNADSDSPDVGGAKTASDPAGDSFDR